MNPRQSSPSSAAPPSAEIILGGDEPSLLDIIDNVLNKGVVLTGDITIALANVDLVYARLSLLLCAADRVLPDESPASLERHRARHVKAGWRQRRHGSTVARGRGASGARSRA